MFSDVNLHSRLPNADITMSDVLIDERLISGTGLLRIPQSVDGVSLWMIYIDVIRPPSVIFKSNRYSPPRQRYCTINFLRDDYVIRSEVMDYPKIRFEEIPDGTAQNLLAVKCAYQGTLTSFANLATALGLPVISIIDLVKPMPSYNNVADSIQFRCEVDTAIQVRLYYRLLVTCTEDSIVQPPPPPPPPPLPPLPPGEPIGDISPPYDGTDNITNPDPIDQDGDPDQPFEVPFGAECLQYEIKGAITTSDTGREERTDIFYGIIEDFYFNPSSVSGDGKDTILIQSRGLAVFNGQVQPCGQPIEQVFLQVGEGVYVSHELISITPVE